MKWKQKKKTDKYMYIKRFIYIYVVPGNTRTPRHVLISFLFKKNNNEMNVSGNSF